MEYNFLQKAYHILHYSHQITDFPGEPVLTFKAVFEERSDFHRSYTLPFNTLVAVLDDGNSDAGTMENGRTHEMIRRRKGDLYFTPVNLPVVYRNVPSLHFIALHFHLDLVPGLDVYQGTDDWIVEHAPGETAAIERAFRLPDRFHALAALKECCFRFCTRHWPEKTDADFTRIGKFRPVLSYVRNQVDARTKVTDLAALMNMRNETFSREFARLFHQTACDFLQDELTKKATALLTVSGCSVKETAAALNFSNEFYFSQFFKRRVGCAPSEYRKRFLPDRNTGRSDPVIIP